MTIKANNLFSIHFFNHDKAREKWIKHVTRQDIHISLSMLFTKGNSSQGIPPFLSPTQLSHLLIKVKTIEYSNPLIPLLPFYASYPFASHHINHSCRKEAYIRALILIAGLDKVIDNDYNHRDVSTNKEVRTTKERSKERRLELLFRALADSTPKQEDIINILLLTQPKSNPHQSPLDLETITSIAKRLGRGTSLIGKRMEIGMGDDVEELVISDGRLAEFVERLGLKDIVVLDMVDWEGFRRFSEENPAFLKAVGAEALSFLGE